MLKLSVKDIKDVPEALREFYEEQDDGSWLLKLDSVDEHPKVKGLKDSHDKNNKVRAKQTARIEELEKKVADLPEGFSRDEWDRLKEFETTHVDDPKLKLEKDELLASRDRLHEQKVQRMEKKFEDDKTALNGKVIKLTEYIRKVLAENVLTKSLLDNGFSKVHLPVLKSHFKSNIIVKEDEDDFAVKIKAGDGEEVDVEKYIIDCAGSEEYKHYLEQARGGGAGGGNNGGGPGGGDTGDNPWKKDQWNLTKQGQIMKNDRPRAERLAKAAGTTMTGLMPK